MKDLELAVKNIDYKGAISDIEALSLSLTLASGKTSRRIWPTSQRA